MSLLDSASELASLIWSQSSRAHTASAEEKAGGRNRLAALLAVMSLVGTSACAQQPQPVRAGPTHSFLISVLDSLGGGPPVKSWNFSQVVADGQCVSDISWEWPEMRHLDHPATLPGTRCGGKGSASWGPNEFEVTRRPLVARWTDQQGEKHSATLDVKTLIGKRTLYGGGELILEFAGPRVNLYLDEPDFANKQPGKYPPMVRHLLATSE